MTTKSKVFSDTELNGSETRNNNWVLTEQAEITDAVNSGQLIIANDVMKTII